MKVGNAVRVRTEYGSYYHKQVNITGLVGIVVVVDGPIGGPVVLLSNGERVAFTQARAWLEVLNEGR